jgi:hypothetical protein
MLAFTFCNINELQTYIGIANPNRIFCRTHLCPELTLPVKVELFHDAIIGCLQHFNLGAAQMVARRQMRSCSTTKRQRFDASVVCSRDDVCREVFDGSRLRVGQ